MTKCSKVVAESHGSSPSRDSDDISFWSSENTWLTLQDHGSNRHTGRCTSSVVHRPVCLLLLSFHWHNDGGWLHGLPSL